jgi:CYTH domain-containing protein
MEKPTLSDSTPLEIERKFLLTGMPALPEHAVAHRMEQGYLPEARGRLRRAVGPDGTPVCTLTFKTGVGLVRREDQRKIPEAEFLEHWPRTEGRRLLKTRYKVADAGFVWEIDRYDDLDLVLAEVELPTPDTAVTPPAWLEPHIEREVTEEPMYQNYEIALRIASEKSD